jgi:hypothetical protein
VRTGAPKPDIATANELRRLLLEAKYISFPNAAAGAAAGVSFEETMRKLGITEAMKPKIKPAQGGRGAMALLAKGDIDIGLTFISEIITEPGVEVVGPLAGYLDADSAGGVRFDPSEGAGGRQGAPGLPFRAGGRQGLQGARDGAGLLRWKWPDQRTLLPRTMSAPGGRRHASAE